MIGCDWRKHGCTRMFSSLYAMRVHQRSCSFHDQSLKKRKRSTPVENLASTAGRSRFRLACDHDTFEARETYTSGEDLNVMEGNDANPLNILGILEKRNETGQTEEDIGDRLVKSAMIMMARISRKAGRKALDDIIMLLTERDFSITKLQRMCRSVSDCLNMENEIYNQRLSDQGFQKVIVYDDNKRFQCELYVRSPIKVLTDQVSGVSKDECLFNCPSTLEGTENYSHPMTSLLGKKGETAVKHAVMSSTESDVMWHCNENSSEESFAGMTQVYSDKSNTSLKQSSFQFYPMHITLLNFSEQYRRKCIVGGTTAFAFLPVKFFANENDNLIEKNLSRSDYLKMIGKCMDVALNELREYGYPGFQCQDAEGTPRRCHPVLSSYCCDLPECHDVLPVKNGNQSVRNCHRCNILTKAFNTYTAVDKRTGEETVSLIQRARYLRSIGKNGEGEEVLSEYSLIDLLPFLYDFPFMGLDPVLDMHIIFAFEPLHNLHLGISKLLKSCLSERLRSTELKTSAISTRGGKTRSLPFRAVRMVILTGINRMLSHIQRYSPITGIRIDFSKGGSDGNEKGLYGPEGNVIGMLEGKDYRNLDMVFPFFGMFLDRACGETTAAVSTNLFVTYVEIVQDSLSYTPDVSSMWNENKVLALERKIIAFKNMANRLYSTYQKSELCTQKVHMLDHIVEDIRRLGGLRYCDASLYEYSHTIVKAAHRATSRRRHSAMEETISAYSKNISCAKIDQETNLVSIQRHRNRSINIIRSLPKADATARSLDCATLVKSGRTVSLSQIERARRLMRRRRIAHHKGDKEGVDKLDAELQSVQKEALEVVQDMGETASRMFHKEMTAMQSKIAGINGGRSSLNVIRVSSGYVSGVSTPTMKDYDRRRRRVDIDENSTRKSQRFVSAKGFYGNPGLRQDCVTLQASDSTNSGFVNVWFGKLLGLFRTVAEPTHGNSSDGEEQWAFIQFFDVTPLQDQVDESLGCIRLVWARGDDDCAEDLDELISNSSTEKERKWFALLPVSTIRGVVQMVRGDYGIDRRCLGVDMEDVSWEKQHFYVNRFIFETDSIEKHEPKCG